MWFCPGAGVEGSRRSGVGGGAEGESAGHVGQQRLPLGRGCPQRGLLACLPGRLGWRPLPAGEKVMDDYGIPFY